MDDAIAQLQRHNRGRDPERLAQKYARMRADAFAFFRGSCHLFYAQLPQHETLTAAPRAWACGDLHLENFGSYKGDNRQVYFDINDFDEAVLAPATWDLVRVVSSVLVARKTLGVTRKAARVLGAVLLDAYADALTQGTARWIERETAEPPVGTLLSAVRERRHRALLDARTHRDGNTRRIDVDGDKALPASPEQVRAVQRTLQRFAATHTDPAQFEVLDVARRVAGTGSLGVDRYVVLVRGKGSPARNHLLDLKAALPPSALPRTRGLRQPAWPDHARRIVAVQRRMQAIPIAWLHAVTVAGEPFVLRRLLPSEDRVALPSLAGNAPDTSNLMRAAGQCVAWAQLRSSGRDGSANADALIAFGAKSAWQKALLQLAEHAAERVEADYRAFKKAYTAGEFDTR